MKHHMNLVAGQRLFRQHAKAGLVKINLPSAGVDYHVPFGGCKGSSFGPRKQKAYSSEFYTIFRTSYQAA